MKTITSHMCRDCQALIWQSQRLRCTSCTLKSWNVSQQPKESREPALRVLHSDLGSLSPGRSGGRVGLGCPVTALGVDLDRSVLSMYLLGLE